MKVFWNKYEKCLKEVVDQIERAKLQNCYLLSEIFQREKVERLREGNETLKHIFKASFDELEGGIQLFKDLESKF